MDLLVGYGSDSGSEPDSPKAPAVGSAPISAAPPTQTLGTAPLKSAPEPLVNGVSTLSDLPAPASERAPLFSGLPMPAIRRKRITAKFSCPIDYGDAPTGGDDDDDDDVQPAAKRMKRTGNKGMSLTDFLPAPKNTKAPPLSSIDDKNQKILGGGGNLSYDDDDLVPGAEDLTGMYLGKGDGEPANEGGDIIEPMVGAAGAATTATIATTDAGGSSRHIRGVHDGQEYIYDTMNGQYYYPDPSAAAHQEYYNHPAAAATTHDDDPTSGLPGGIQFKEISGAQLRYMEPGQRAELNALRSALGDDYEAKLKSEAAKVGAVSKLAKRKHQLSSLYVQAKEQELEDMEKRTSGAKTKAETQRKYGW